MYGAGAASAAARQQFIGESYSSYFSYISLIGFLLQLFVVSRLFKFLGVGRSLFIHPIVALISYLMMLRAPSFEAIRVLKIADNSIAYSLGNTTMQALWLPTSRETKFKAKQAIDSFCVRAGDVLQAGVVYTGELTALTVTVELCRLTRVRVRLAPNRRRDRARSRGIACPGSSWRHRGRPTQATAWRPPDASRRRRGSWSASPAARRSGCSSASGRPRCRSSPTPTSSCCR